MNFISSGLLEFLKLDNNAFHAEEGIIISVENEIIKVTKCLSWLMVGVEQAL